MQNRGGISGFILRNFNTLGHLLFRSGVMEKSKDRQPYHIGWFNPDKKLEDLRFHLHTEWGFGDHFASFSEKGEVLNWRKLDKTGKQYHLRVYNDGEIRGHYEYQPEGHTLDHLRAKDYQESKLEFLKYLGDFAVYKKTVTELKPLEGVYEPPAEFVPEKQDLT